MAPSDIRPGQKVHYVPAVGEPENGIVKRYNDRVAWVVYKCDGQWARYREFTAACTALSDPREGWVP